ncbi:MAG: tyrosine-protein phosphatase [Anaerolineae bacterium]|nr:tyrosine-protein phosphatase [Anaerolineae bacterium]
MTDRRLKLEGSYNTRDLGGYTTLDGKTTRWRRFLRSDSLHRLTPADQRALIEAGLKTVIDLRHAWEISKAPNVFIESAQVQYVNISLMENLVAGIPEQGQPERLADVYRLAVDYCAEAFKQVFDVMTDEAFPVLIHCTAGKDRTGMISALALSIAGVPSEVISEDYTLTGIYSEPMLPGLRAEARAAGRNMEQFERMLLSVPEDIEAWLAYLESKYGGAVAYLRHIGLSEAQIESLRQQLVE